MYIETYPLQDCLLVLEDEELYYITVIYYSEVPCTKIGYIISLQAPNARRCCNCGKKCDNEKDAQQCEKSHQEGVESPKRGPYRPKEPSLYLNKEVWEWDEEKQEYYKIEHKEQLLNKEETRQIIKKYINQDLRRAYPHLPTGPTSITYYNLRKGCRWNRSWAKSGGMDE